MMTFYSAIGSYRIKNQNGRKLPYIQRLGKLHPISIPEFVIWSTLLWEVLSYDELRGFYESQMRMLEVPKYKYKNTHYGQDLKLWLNLFPVSFSSYETLDGLHNISIPLFSHL